MSLVPAPQERAERARFRLQGRHRGQDPWAENGDQRKIDGPSLFEQEGEENSQGKEGD